MSRQVIVFRVPYHEETPEELTKRYRSPIGPFLNWIGYYQAELRSGRRLNRQEVVNLYRLARALVSIEDYVRRSDDPADLDAYIVIRRELPQIVCAAIHMAGLDPFDLLDPNGQIVLNTRVWLVFIAVSLVGEGDSQKDMPDFDSRLLEAFGSETQRQQLERDKWIYEQKRGGRKIVDILTKLDNHEDWEPLVDADGIRNAVRRHTELRGLSVS
jgi:hypothetical protein